jgi:hypothetical protein
MPAGFFAEILVPARHGFLQYVFAVGQAFEPVSIRRKGRLESLTYDLRQRGHQATVDVQQTNAHFRVYVG